MWLHYCGNEVTVPPSYRLTDQWPRGPDAHAGLGGGGPRALSPCPGQAAGVGTPTRPQRWEWAKWAPPAVHTEFPISEAAQTHNIPLIRVQRPKRCSWSECIKCRLKKDFTRLVTAENNLNFNSPGRNFKKKTTVNAVCRVIWIQYQIDILAWKPHAKYCCTCGTGRSKYASQTFVCFLSLF